MAIGRPSSRSSTSSDAQVEHRVAGGVDGEEGNGAEVDGDGVFDAWRGFVGRRGVGGRAGATDSESAAARRRGREPGARGGESNGQGASRGATGRGDGRRDVEHEISFAV